MSMKTSAATNTAAGNATATQVAGLLDKSKAQSRLSKAYTRGGTSIPRKLELEASQKVLDWLTIGDKVRVNSSPVSAKATKLEGTLIGFKVDASTYYAVLSTSDGNKKFSIDGKSYAQTASNLEVTDASGYITVSDNGYQRLLIEKS